MSTINRSDQEAVSRELDHRLVELQSLFEMSQVLNSSLKLRSILNNLLLSPMGRMMITRGMVLVSNENIAFEVAIAKGLPRDLVGKKIYIENELTQPVFVAEFNEVEKRQLSFFVDQDIELIIPIVSTNRTTGLIGLGRKLDQVRFSEGEIEFLSSLSNIAASAIENALMFHKLEQVNRTLDKKIQELNTIFEISKELILALDREKIINLLIYAIMGEMVVNRCFVFLKDERKLRPVAARGVRTEKEHLKIFAQKGFLKSLANVSHPVIVDETNLSRNLRLLQRENLAVIIPMKVQEQTKGVVILGEKITKKPYKSDELDFPTTLCNQAMIAIENARLFEETLEKQRIEEELNIARDIQQRLLPREYPEVKGLEVKGVNIPSRQVGGDYFDCIPLDDDHIALAIADVSGKGIPASLLMSSLQSGLRNVVSSGADISAMVGKLNDFIYAHTTFDKFITFFYAEIDLKEKTLSYVNAGHNPPYLYSADKSCKKLETGGLILGMMPNMPYECERVQLNPGDLLVMYTDGVTEAKSVQDEDFDEYRLVDFIEQSMQLNVENLLDNIVEKVQSFTRGAPQSDDITMLVARFTL